MKKRNVGVNIDERLYQHLTGIAKVKQMFEGRAVGLAELFREAVIKHYHYEDFTLAVEINSATVTDVLGDPKPRGTRTYFGPPKNTEELLRGHGDVTAVVEDEPA